MYIRTICGVIVLALLTACGEEEDSFCGTGNELIPNGSFEGTPFPTDFSATFLSQGGTNLGPLGNNSWYATNSSPDVNSESGGSVSGGNRSENATKTPWGDKWISGVRAQGGVGGGEAIGVRLATPIQAGVQYKLSLGLKSRDEITVYIANSSTNLTLANNNQYQKVGVFDGVNKWKEHYIVFTPETNANHILLTPPEQNQNWFDRWWNIDNVSLKKASTVCQPRLCDGTIANLIQNPSFEEVESATDSSWDFVCDNICGRITWPGSSSNYVNDETRTPVSEASTLLLDNETWISIHTTERVNIVDRKDGNTALQFRLSSPLQPGQRYRFSFLGATHNTLWYDRARVRVGVNSNSVCNNGSIGCANNGWNKKLAADQLIHDDSKLSGDVQEWHHYTQDFVASGPYEFLFIQARGGYEPAVDGICLTSDFFAPPVLFYNTNNSVVRVDQHGIQSTISFGNDYNLFGLTSRRSTELTPVDNNVGFLSSDPNAEYAHLNSNSTLQSLGLATDIIFEDEYDAYATAEYDLKRLVGLGTNSTQISSMPVSIPAPFSLAKYGDYIFVAGENRFSITKTDYTTSEVIGHGITMAGFMDIGTDGSLYIADPGSNSIKVVSENQLQTLIAAHDAGTVPNIGAFSIFSNDNLLAANGVMRGPIGVDEHDGVLWATVDLGTGQSGRIVRVDTTTGVAESFIENVDGVRDLKLWVP